MLIFWITAAVVLVTALAVVLLPNPLFSALCLATNLVAVAAIYAMLGAHFLAAAQITVYAGAIMVLVVFVLMLLNFKQEKFRLQDFMMFLAAFSASGFCASVLIAVLNQHFSAKIVYSGNQTLGVAKEIGAGLFNANPLIFQLCGVLLLTSLVGAVMLANQRRMPKVSKL